MLLPNYFNVGDTVNKPYFKKRWSVPFKTFYSSHTFTFDNNTL